MKKLLYSIMALAGLTMASCTQEHIDVQYIPENAVAPTLGAIEGCDLSDGGADIVVEYTKADFGVATANVHNLYIAKTEDMADMKKAKATFTDTTITLTQADINVVALDFAEAGSEVDLYFAVVANLNTDKGAAVAGTDLRSNVVKATFKSYVADVLPTEKFDKVWVIGNYCGWDHAKTQFLFDYTASGNVYSGVIDFADAEGVSLANTGFKLTGIAGWDDTCNWGEETKATEVDEPASIQLITGGGSQDIMRYAKRFYGFEFDKTTLVLKKAWGADQIGIIGLNGDWETDIVMEYNAKWTRFYADIDAAADTEMKFRADAAWDLNWGVDCAQGGDNIPVPAGQYRVYFNPATGLIEFNAKNYGTEEDTGAGTGTGTTPEGPVTEPDRWGVVGTITGWGGEADLYMSEVGENLFVRNGVTVTADDQFKIRFNNDWAVNYGAAGDVEPFAVTVGEELVLAAGGKNLSAPAGTYDIYFNIVDFKIWVMNEGETPGGVEVKTVKIYGDVSATGWTNCNAWIWDDGGANYTGGTWPGLALETAEVDGKTYYVFDCAPEMIGKTVSVIFNNGSEQTVDIKGVELNDDVVITLTEKDDAGKWLATVNGEAPVTPEPPAETTYGLIGDFNGWAADVDLVARGDGWYVTEALTIEAEGKLLIRLNDAWDEKYGNDGSKLVIGENTLTYGGADMWIDAGSYDFYFNPAASKLILAVAGSDDPTAGADTWTIKGDVNGTAWNTDIATELVDGLYVAKNVTFQDSWGEGANFKVLKNGTWMGSTAGGTHEVGAAIAVSEGGGNITMNVTLDTPYDIYIDGANLNVYVVEAGATPAI
ncbi:MAG: starch-binding protein [Alistipes sp.]|nr:starch-binding protein [Alistipes sp.]